MPTLVLVDGSSYLYRAFHALPDLRTSQGEPTGALRGVLAMLRRMVQDEKPDYFAVVFDAPGKTFRDAMYAAYKANRAAMPDELGKQIEPLYRCVRAEGWPLLMVDGVEADDVIGTLTCIARQRDVDVIVSTSDKDLAQLVRPGVKLVNTMSNETLDEAGVAAKFGVRADQLLDLLTLTGDSIDNVPGVDKVGPKTAAKWINQYGSLDEVIAHAHEITGVVGENLRKALDWLPQGKRLLTVKTDCELPVVELEALRFATPDRTTLRELYGRYEFKTWLRDLAVVAEGGDPQTALFERDMPVDNSDEPSRAVPAVPEHYETVFDEAGLERWAGDIESADLVALHVEAGNMDPIDARIVGIAFAIAPGRACYIPVAHRYAGAPAQLTIEQVSSRMRRWFADPARAKVGYNLKYDQHVLANHELPLAGVAYDTLLESYVLESHKPHDLESLAFRHLDVKAPAYADVSGKGVAQIAFDQVPVESAGPYTARCADLALRVHALLSPSIESDSKLEHVYRSIELALLPILLRMERHGVLIDRALLEAQSRELGVRIQELEEQSYAAAGQPFNLGSPKQLCAVLYDKMKLPVRKKTATGQPSTDEEVLQELAADYPLPKLILEHRALCKLKSTYTDKLPLKINARTGRVHTTFSQATAVTGRLASLDPNLQNIPVRTSEGRRIREAFVAPPGHHIVSADYSQIELRIMAHLSQDPALLQAFREGADIHRRTAADIFGVPPDDVTVEQRRYIKAVNFGLIYGMSGFGLATQLGIERGAAQQYIDRYFARYPGVADYMKRTRELARSQGYVETVFGRRLWLPDIRAASGPRRAGAERAAINAPMQGTAADLVKLAMIAVDQWITDEKLATRLVLQVHDELVFEVPAHELERVRAELPPRMEGVAELSVPLVADLGVGPNWEQAH
ncbi:MAG: DNA polymerase I [Pseudomonadota bacterium]|nr:DNA polymerase I [Pseudomonadota bacterium]